MPNAFGETFSWLQLLLGFGLAALISLAAYAARSLNRSGAAAATLLGTAVFGLGGLPWAGLLLGFFISSSLLSRLFRRRKAAVDEKFSKGNQRDAAQVAANGGIAGLLALLQAVLPESPLPWLAAAAALAAANADTWATELGVLSPVAPRRITSGKPVEMGTSGGITPLGTLAALAGGLFIAAIAAFFPPSNVHLPLAGVLLGVTLAGLLGSLVDSLLGATVQAIYFCPRCGKETERHPLHTCATPTRRLRGLGWLDNDGVNLFCTLSAGALAVLAGSALISAANLPAASVSGGGAMKLTTSAFQDGESIPAKYTCNGEDRSPALAWSGIPPATRSFALLMHDPDAPGGDFIHWVVYNLPARSDSLPQGAPARQSLAGGGTQGRNDFGATGYGGPCPPPGNPHRYVFTLYALDSPPDLPPGLTAARLRAAIQGHILDQATLSGLFQR